MNGVGGIIVFDKWTFPSENPGPKARETSKNDTQNLDTPKKHEPNPKEVINLQPMPPSSPQRPCEALSPKP